MPKPAHVPVLHPLVLAMACVLSPPALAQQRADAPGEAPHDLDRVVVVASKVAEPLRQVAATVDVVDRAEIERRQVQDLPQLVRYQPGVDVPVDAARFGAQGFSIRGLDGNRVEMEVDGVPVADAFSVGQFAAAGHPLFVLADTTKWYVIANFRETELDNAQPGSQAKVYLMADTGKVFQARVESIGYGVHAEDSGMDLHGLPMVGRSINWVRVAQRFPVRFVVENPDPELFRIGASAVAVIIGPPPAEQ